MADRLLSLSLAALAALAAWLTLGVQGVVDEATLARVGGLPSWWWLAGLQLAFVAPVAARSIPADRLWPLAITGLLCLPWLPGRIPASFLIWYGPVAGLVWALVVLGLAGPALGHLAGRPWTRDPRRAPWLLAALVVVVSAAGAWAIRARIPEGDEPHYLVITQSLLSDRDLRIENNHQQGDYLRYVDRRLPPDYVQRGRDGQIYSIHAPGLSVLIAPAFAIAGWPGAVLAMMAMAAATAALIWVAVWRLTGGDASAAWLAGAITACAAPGYFHAFTIFPDGAGALAVAIGLWAVVRLETGDMPSRARLAAVGTALAALPWLHTRFAILAGGLGLILLFRLWARPARLPAVAALFAVPVASAFAWFGFFWIVWGTPNPAAPYGQATQSAWAHLRPAVPGLLFDQQFGLVPNAPVYGVAILGLASLAARHRRLAAELTLLLVTYLLVVSSYRMWWGGHSAPARFLVAALPLLSLPLAAWWSHGTPARRALTLVLLVVSAALVVARVATDHGALIYNERDGFDLLLDRANRSVDLPLAWPSLHRDIVGDAWRDVAVWLVVAVVSGGMGLLAASRTGQAWTWAVVAMSMTVMGASSLVWQGPAESATTVRSAIDLLDRWPERDRALGWQSSPYRLVPPEVVPRQLVLAGTGRPTRPRGQAPVFSAALVPGGHYALSTTGDRPTGRLSISVGGHPHELEAIDLAANPGDSPSVAIAVPLRLQSLTIHGDEAARSSIGRLALHPVQVGSVPGAPAGTARRAARYGAWRMFALDDNAYLEPPGFWTRGFATAELFIDSAAAGDDSPERRVTLRLRAGPVSSSVVLTSGVWRQSVTLQPGETTVVTLPDGRPHGQALRLEASTGFRPTEHDAASKDVRSLGVWVEVVTGEK